MIFDLESVSDTLKVLRTNSPAARVYTSPDGVVIFESGLKPELEIGRVRHSSLADDLIFYCSS